MESVYISADVKNEIRSNVIEFLQMRPRMQEANLPSHRTFMLYGPPGNGKTSYIKALANELNLHVFQMTIGNGSLATNENIVELLKLMPNPSVLLLDDIDGYAGVGPIAATDKTSGGVSHDKLLQVCNVTPDSSAKTLTSNCRRC
jgi:SpoVK/Ycf46/Vps4 family AAA+-type ATPase